MMILYDSPMLALYDLITEPGGLLTPYMRSIPDGESGGVVAVSRLIQSQNRKLQSADPENPFSKELEPFSYFFTEKAIALAGTDEGRKDWMALVSARMGLAKILKAPGMVVDGPNAFKKKRHKNK
jgi:hypothetical protein